MPITPKDRALSIIDEMELEGATVANRDLVRRFLVQALRIAEAGHDRLDLKILESSIRELNQAFDTFSPYRGRRKVTVFGSARTKETSPEYGMTVEFSRKIATEGWMVVTGGGPGIMEAGIRGAGEASAIGVGIRLPFEGGEAGRYLEADKVVDMKYFFTRKLVLMKESSAFVSMPGGFGTLDETFELLTLMQTGKASIAPLILMEPDGIAFWSEIEKITSTLLLRDSYVSQNDSHLYSLHHNIDDAILEILAFYTNYHSMRWVDDTLVVRTIHENSDESLDVLNAEFTDILDGGEIQRIGATSIEVADHDHLDLHRIAFRFNRSSYARLREFIDALNGASRKRGSAPT